LPKMLNARGNASALFYQGVLYVSGG